MKHRANRAKPGQAQATFDRLIAIETDDCVLWPHSINSKGYGQIGVNGKSTSVHVLACEHHHGPRPPRQEVAHSCGVKLCVNGRHVRWSSHWENEQDKWTHGTHRAFSKYPDLNPEVAS